MSQAYKPRSIIRFDYAIGDVQGCYEALMLLLEKINFDEKLDRLWFVGDLVNRGPDSLAVINFIKNLAITPIITLGNHDLYLLTLIYLEKKLPNEKDTLTDILKSKAKEEIGEWLRKQSILHYDDELKIVMTHAGIPPIWSLNEAITHAQELENALKNSNFKVFLNEMLGDFPNTWQNTLAGNSRLRLICNYFTRMRYCNLDGSLDLKFKGPTENASKNVTPWFAFKNRKPIDAEIIFGHWASLNNASPAPKIHAIDTGYIWGGALTALRLQDKNYFQVFADKA